MYKLMIVEDDRGIAEAVKKQAESWGLEALAVSDFSGVMDEFARFEPHIVLLDISLPFYNGYHWCGEIRKVSKLPVIFISSASDNMNIIMAMNMGADDFIAKPFDQSVLIAKIRLCAVEEYTYAQGRCLRPRRRCFELRRRAHRANEKRVPHSALPYGE